MAALNQCPSCHAPWPEDITQLSNLRACPGCSRAVAVTLFPALVTERAGPALPEKLVTEGEASCFYHADKKAVVPCSACGRFLCALCDVTVGERHLCPSCIESGRTKGRFVEFETTRTLWDTTALTLAVAPLVLCFYFTVVTAPAALVVAIAGWRKPSSIIPRGRWRLWVAIILSLLEIAGWTVGLVYLIREMTKG